LIWYYRRPEFPCFHSPFSFLYVGGQAANFLPQLRCAKERGPPNKIQTPTAKKATDLELEIDAVLVHHQRLAVFFPQALFVSLSSFSTATEGKFEPYGLAKERRRMKSM